MKTGYGRVWIALCLSSITSQIMATEALYFWRDEAGRPHYSESPPGDQRNYRKLTPGDLPNIHITPPTDESLYPAPETSANKNSGAYYKQRSARDRNHHSKSECRHYERQLRRMEGCVRENDCGLNNRQLRHQHRHWNVMYHKYCDF